LNKISITINAAKAKSPPTIRPTAIILAPREDNGFEQSSPQSSGDLFELYGPDRALRPGRGVVGHNRQREAIQGTPQGYLPLFMFLAAPATGK
jgi:hypothetical protein